MNCSSAPCLELIWLILFVRAVRMLAYHTQQQIGGVCLPRNLESLCREPIKLLFFFKWWRSWRYVIPHGIFPSTLQTSSRLLLVCPHLIEYICLLQVVLLIDVMLSVQMPVVVGHLLFFRDLLQYYWNNIELELPVVSVIVQRTAQ